MTVRTDSGRHSVDVAPSKAEASESGCKQPLATRAKERPRSLGHTFKEAEATLVHAAKVEWFICSLCVDPLGS